MERERGEKKKHSHSWGERKMVGVARSGAYLRCAAFPGFPGQAAGLDTLPASASRGRRSPSPGAIRPRATAIRPRAAAIGRRGILKCWGCCLFELVPPWGFQGKDFVCFVEHECRWGRRQDVGGGGHPAAGGRTAAAAGDGHPAAGGGHPAGLLIIITKAYAFPRSFSSDDVRSPSSGERMGPFYIYI